MVDLSNLPKHAPEYDLEKLLEAGCHFGHQSRRWHPKMKPWIYMEKDGVHIFDLAKTAAQLQLAYDYAYSLGKQGKTLVVVGTKRQAKDLVKELCEKMDVGFIYSRWLGGLLTNWEQVKRSLKRMIDVEEGLKTGKFSGYTKYERTMMEKEVNRLERFFGGLRKLKNAPDALFIIDPGREKVVVKEAGITNVPVIALIDTNTDPTPIDLPIPANDDAFKSIELVMTEVLSGYEAGRKAK
jgi:small subunit ribosomal protein S2